MAPSKGNDLTHTAEHYVEDPMLSNHHYRRNSTAELSGDNSNDETRKKSPEGEIQTGEAARTRITGDGKKGSEGDVPPAKTPKTVKAIKQPGYYQTYLVPGINTEKYPYEAGDED